MRSMSNFYTFCFLPSFQCVAEMQTIMYPADWPVFNYIYLRTFLCMFLFVKYAFGEKKHCEDIRNQVLSP